MNQPTEPEILTFYRIVHSNPPTEQDMRSHHDLGLPLRSDTTEVRRLAQGVSLFDDLDAARKKARGKPWLSNGYIARLRIPISAGISIEKTGRHPAHWTIWENAHVMLEFVEHVEPIILPIR